MRRDSLLRSTSFRLAAVFAVVFLGAFLATGIAVYELMKWELVQRQDRALQETYAVIANAYGDRDLTDLLETVEANVRTTRGHDRVFLVRRTGRQGARRQHPAGPGARRLLPTCRARRWAWSRT